SAVAALIAAHVAEPPAPPSESAPNLLPEALDRAVLRAIAKRPDDRFPTAAAFEEELASITSALQVSKETRFDGLVTKSLSALILVAALLGVWSTVIALAVARLLVTRSP